MKTYNFSMLTIEQAEQLLQLWLNEEHVEAKRFLQATGVASCASCLDNATYIAWMQWWINSLN